MKSFIYTLKSDILKLKRTSIKKIHFIIPLVAIVAFLGYYSFAPYDSESKVSVYIQVISTALPLIVSLVASTCIEQESMAGNFIVMLAGGKQKEITFISKIAMLIMFGGLSIVIACIGFGTGFSLILNEYPFGIYCYLIIAIILIGFSIYEYILHLFLSMKYGKSVSIGVGSMEFVLSTLLLTGLGDNKWFYIPCSYGSRITNNYIKSLSSTDMFDGNMANIYIALAIGLVVTILLFIASIIWFRNWEGRAMTD